MSGEGSSSLTESTSDILHSWKQYQHSLKQKLILKDDFPWKLKQDDVDDGDKDKDKGLVLKYIGGVDVSCLKDDQSIACGTIVVLDFFTGNVVYHDSAHVKLHVPYIAGFLAFREAPVLVQLLKKMKTDNNPYYPQLVMVDGNGILHPRGFGLASHLGVLGDIPTIGVGKKLHCVDGLTEKGVRKCLQAEEGRGENFITLTGRSGCIHGAAMRSTEGSVRPIFISIGHRISLDTAIKIVKMTCKYRVPEPIRQADKRSRSYVQRPQEILKQINCLNLGENNSQVTAGTSQPTIQGMRTWSRGRGRGRWREREHLLNEGEGKMWQERRNNLERAAGQSNGRGRGSGEGTVQGRGRGRFEGGNGCKCTWIQKNVA